MLSSGVSTNKAHAIKKLYMQEQPNANIDINISAHANGNYKYGPKCKGTIFPGLKKLQ